MTAHLKPDSSIFVAGHGGLVGSALVQRLNGLGCHNLILRTRAEVDLLNQAAVQRFFAETKPQFVFVAAARVGGILANDQFCPDFLYENLMIEANVIQAAAQNGTEKLMFLGSSCVYPKMASQPVKEEALMTGLLEPTNLGYATAKISGLLLCQLYKKQYGKNFISVVPTNVYGPGDNFHPEQSHVIPALIRKFHHAKVEKKSEVTLWGSGRAIREFLYIDDLSEALLMLMNKYDSSQLINVGGGKDITIRELSEIVQKVVGYDGQLLFDTTKPDGAPRKVLDNTKMTKMGWTPKTSLIDGLTKTYRWALDNLFLSPKT